MGVQLQAEKMVLIYQSRISLFAKLCDRSLIFVFLMLIKFCLQARVAAELQAKELKVAQEKQLSELEALLQVETQAKRDEEIVRNLQARLALNCL